MNKQQSRGALYIIDGNNYVCYRESTSEPSCEALANFQQLVDDWIEKEKNFRRKNIEVIVVYDPGAKNCNIQGDFSKILIAPPGEKADKVIAVTARKQRSLSPNRLIRIISDDRKDEFHELISDGFEVHENSFLDNKFYYFFGPISEKEYPETQDDIDEITDLLYDEDENDDFEYQVITLPNYNYKKHINNLDDDSVETKIQSIRALRHFPNKEVVNSLIDFISINHPKKIIKTSIRTLTAIVPDTYLYSFDKNRLIQNIRNLLENNLDQDTKRQAEELLIILQSK